MLSLSAGGLGGEESYSLGGLGGADEACPGSEGGVGGGSSSSRSNAWWCTEGRDIASASFSSEGGLGGPKVGFPSSSSSSFGGVGGALPVPCS